MWQLVRKGSSGSLIIHTTARNVVKKGEYKKGVLNNGEHVHYSDVLMLVGLLTIIMVLFLKPSFFDTHTEQIREINKKASSSCKGNFCGNKVSGDKTLPSLDRLQ